MGGVFDTDIHDFGVLATFAGDATRVAWVGNTINNLIGTPQPEHGMRLQGGEKQFIAHNSLTNLTNTKTAITVRGDGQRHVMIYKNKMDRLLGVNPQNAQTIAAISQVTIEGNYVGQNPDYTGTTWENSFNGISIEATNVAIRNNVVDGYRNAINVSHDFNGVVSGWVDIYHNTVNWRPISPISFDGGRIAQVFEVSNVNVHNNFITAPTTDEASTVVYLGTNTNITEANNIIATTADYALNPLPGSEADANDIVNYQLVVASTAIDAGSDSIPVFYDANNVMRAVATPDVGAFESITAQSIARSSAQTNETPIRGIPTVSKPALNNIQLSVFPNPFHDEITIQYEITTPSLSAVSIYIRDVLGRVVQQPIIYEQQTQGLYRQRVSTQHLSDGLYYLVLENYDIAERQVFKMIKHSLK